MNKNILKIGDKVYCRIRSYQVFCGCLPSAPWYDICEEIDTERIGTIKGFQDDSFDGRDIILRWNDFLWNTAMPSNFLIKKTEYEKEYNKTKKR